MNFSEFDAKLHEIFNNDGVLSYSIPEMKKMHYDAIKREISIQENLLNFGAYEITDIDIEYAIASLGEAAFFNTNIRYFLFLLKNLQNKARYEYAKSFVDYILSTQEYILRKDDSSVSIECIKTLLDVCLRMKIREEEIWCLTIEYLHQNPDDVYHLATRVALYNIDSGRAEIVKSILMDRVTADSEIGNYITLETLLEEVNKTKKSLLEKKIIQRKLADSYIKLAESDESSIRKMVFSQKVAKSPAARRVCRCIYGRDSLQSEARRCDCKQGSVHGHRHRS